MRYDPLHSRGPLVPHDWVLRWGAVVLGTVWLVKAVV